MTVREVRTYRKPVPPGRYLGASGVFAALGLLAEWAPARTPAIMAAWAFDLAVLFQAGPASIVGAITPKAGTGGGNTQPRNQPYPTGTGPSRPGQGHG